jgi:hypothetical protein
MRYRLRSFRRLDHKVISDLNRDRVVVFDLHADPGEQTPVGDGPDPLTEAASRDAEWGSEWLTAFRRALPAGGAASDIPPDVLQKLKDLGYVYESESQGESGASASAPATGADHDSPETQEEP